MPLMQDTADRRRDPRRKLALFLVLVFGASTPFWLLLTSPGPAQASSLYLFGLMWVPALAAMATLFVFQRNLRGVGWGLGKPRYLLVGYLLPVVYAGVAYGIVWLSGLGRVDFAALPGSGPVRSPLMLIAGAATVGVVLSAFSAAGEEIGWRGLLVPQLARLRPFMAVALISGAIWTVWHLPLILFGGYRGGAPLWFSLVCFSVMAMSVSFPAAWLRLASGSVWPAVLLHASHNLFVLRIFDVVTRDTGPTRYFVGEFGLALALTTFVVAIVFWRLAVRSGLTRGVATPDVGAVAEPAAVAVGEAAATGADAVAG